MTTPNTSTPTTRQPSGARATARKPGRESPKPAADHTVAGTSATDVTVADACATDHTVADACTTDATVADAVLWIELLLRQFPELLVELAPSYRSPSAPPTTPSRDASPSAPAGPTRAEREEALRAEQDHGLTPSGSRTSPLRLHVSDAVRDITDGVVELDEAVHDRLHLPRPRREQVAGRLLRVAGLLDRAADDDVLLEHIRDEARRMARRCTRALGGAEPVVRVSGRCPWCASVSLRAFPARRAVLCVNPACRCADRTCDCRTDPAHRHAWSEGAWARLAAESGGDLAELTASTEDTARREGTR